MRGNKPIRTLSGTLPYMFALQMLSLYVRTLMSLSTRVFTATNDFQD